MKPELSDVELHHGSKKMHKMRYLWPKIRSKLDVMTAKELLAELEKNGLKLSLATLKTYIARLRFEDAKKAAAAAKQTVSVTEVVTEETVVEAVEVESAVVEATSTPQSAEHSSNETGAEAYQRKIEAVKKFFQPMPPIVLPTKQREYK